MGDRRKMMGRLFANVGGMTREQRHEWATQILQRPHDRVTTFSMLTDEDVHWLVDAAEHPPTDDEPPCGEDGCVSHDPDGWCAAEDGATWQGRGI